MAAIASCQGTRPKLHLQGRPWAVSRQRLTSHAACGYVRRAKTVNCVTQISLSTGSENESTSEMICFAPVWQLHQHGLMKWEISESQISEEHL